MKRSRKAILAIMVCASWFTTDTASAGVDLVLSANPQSVAIGDEISVSLLAVSPEAIEFTALDVLLQWDSGVMALEGVTNGGHNWDFIPASFPRDVGLDGLNADCGADVFCEPYTGIPFNDGDALFQALAFSPAVATPEGFLVATFTFTAIAPGFESPVWIADALGASSRTRVLQPGAVNVTGSLGATLVNIGPSLCAVDVHMAAGGTAEVWVVGEIAQQEAIGVTILAWIEERQGNAGSVVYTPAPPQDILQRGDPWPGTGIFDAFDTNETAFGSDFNGSVDDNGTFLAEVVDYSGPLVSLPITASSDATGVWDIRLCEDPCGTADGSLWNGELEIPTARRHGIVRIVDWGDGDDSQTIDMRDQSEFLACFTGGGASDPPAYPLAPELRCSVYDFDGNGAVNLIDYDQMQQVHLGP